MLPGLAPLMMGSSEAALVSGLSVTAFPPATSKGFSSIDGASHSGTTPTVTATATGGSGTYTYAWARISGDEAITATSAGTAATAFSASLAPDSMARAVFRCTVTDTVTHAVVFVDVTVTIHHVDLR